MEHIARIQPATSDGSRTLALTLGLAIAGHLAVLGAAGRVGSHRPSFDAARAPLQFVEIEAPMEPAMPAAPPDRGAPEPVAAAPKTLGKPAAADRLPAAPSVPAHASKVMTAPPRDDEPLDLPTIASGDGIAVGGAQSGHGKGNDITMDKRAAADGKPGGTGSSGADPAPPKKPPAEDRSRPIALAGASTWNCPFPPEADAEQIDRAVVGVQVSVAPDGSATSAAVVSEPGHGFGRAARGCALARRYQPALDASGAPVSGQSLVNVRFSR